MNFKRYFCNHLRGFQVIEIVPTKEWKAFDDLNYLVNQGSVKRKCIHCGNISVVNGALIRQEISTGEIRVS